MSKVKTNEEINRRSKSKKVLAGEDFTERAEFPNGKLPVKKEVIEAMLYLLRSGRAGKEHRSVTEAASIVAYILIDHWTFCNIYTFTHTNVASKVLKLYKEFMNNHQTRKERRTESWETRMKEYVHHVKTSLFDISTEDDTRRKNLEKEYGVKMSDIEINFLEDQKTIRVGYCDNFVDRKWERQVKRKVQEMESLKKRKNDSSACLTPVDYPEDDLIELDTKDDNYQPEEESVSKSKKRKFSDEKISQTDLMPEAWRHIRKSERIIKPEYYKAVDTLKSKYHCSNSQAEAAVIITANTLFGGNWKFHNEENIINKDTAPSIRSVTESGKAFEALALKCIVDEMMSSESVVITYHDDSSKKKGTGSFSVQGLTINGKFRALPSIAISSETTKNLADLKITVLKILSVCSDVPVADLFKKSPSR